MNTYGGALNPAPVNQPANQSPKWIIWGLVVLGLAAVGVVGWQVYKMAGAAPGAEAEQTQPLSPELKATITELKGFVEKERGLKFKRNVKVTLLSEKQFKAYVSDASASEPETDEVDVGRVTFEALGLIEKNIDLDALGETAAGQSLLGWYDSEEKALFVRGNKVTPFIKTILVHELTHALQDQHFDIVREDLYEANDDSSLGLEAVVEGDATRVEMAYYESLTAEEERLVELEANDAGDPATSEVPDALSAWMAVPYQLGPVFMEAMFQDGGNDQLNKALKNPPVTSEQLLYPDLYLANEPAVPVATPPADGKAIDDGMFSQVGLVVILQAAMDPEVAFQAAEGWGGDQYVVWENGDKSCMRFDMVMETPRDQRELNAALRTWAKEHGGATVTTVGAATRTTACL